MATAKPTGPYTPDALGLFTLEQERDVSEQVDVAALTRMGGYGNKTKTAAYGCGSHETG